MAGYSCIFHYAGRHFVARQLPSAILKCQWQKQPLRADGGYRCGCRCQQQVSADQSDTWCG